MALRRDVAALVAALAISNAAWALFALRPSRPEDAPPAPTPEARAESPLTESRLQAIETRLGIRPGAEAVSPTSKEKEIDARPGLRASAATPPPAGASAPAASTTAAPPVHRATALEEPPRRDPRAADAPRNPLSGWIADVVQVSDPARRESGLAAIATGMGSRDPTEAAAALYALAQVRDATFDRERFRAPVLARLGDPDAAVSGAAAYALIQVGKQPGDLERVLSAAERADPPPLGLLHVAAMLDDHRVQGRTAALFVSALAKADDRTSIGIANVLRGVWSAPDVEEAAVAAWKRRESKDVGLWYHILGQITPTREVRVRAIFEILTADPGHNAPQLLDRALKEALDPSARPLAARLAAEGLTTATNALSRRLMLDVLRRYGDREQVGTVRAFASNTMVGEDLRTEAARVADAIDRPR